MAWGWKVIERGWPDRVRSDAEDDSSLQDPGSAVESNGVIGC
jgi:hypothetical protein